jgi:V/A-type H+-transporting ATPase subunit K
MKRLFLFATLACGLIAAFATTLLSWPDARAAETAPPAALMDSAIWSWGLASAALATGLSSLGAGFAVARLGAAAVGALAEKPELFARLLILVGLAEGIAIYGLIVSILILNRLL